MRSWMLFAQKYVFTYVIVEYPALVAEFLISDF